MKLAYGLKLKDIISYLNGTDYVQIEQTDVYLKHSSAADEIETVYEGCVLSIPWYLLDYYLDNSPDGEAIGVFIKDGRPYFDITVCEDFTRLAAVEGRINNERE